MLFLFTILFVVVTTAVHDTHLVHFRGRSTLAPAFLRRLERLLGYAPINQYAGRPGTLVVYADDATLAQLLAHVRGAHVLSDGDIVDIASTNGRTFRRQRRRRVRCASSLLHDISDGALASALSHSTLSDAPDALRSEDLIQDDISAYEHRIRHRHHHHNDDASEDHAAAQTDIATIHWRGSSFQSPLLSNRTKMTPSIVSLRVLLHPAVGEHVAQHIEQLINSPSTILRQQQHGNDIESSLSSLTNTTRAQHIDSTCIIISNVSFSSRRSFSRLIDHLVDAPGVLYVEPVLPVLLTNLWSSARAQNSNGISTTIVRDAALCAASKRCAPYWASGLDGSSQLLAISDTGIATDTCFFSDPDNRPVSFITSRSCPSTECSTIPNTGHSKIHSYWVHNSISFNLIHFHFHFHLLIFFFFTYIQVGVGGDKGDSNGHGTHVAGTAAGRAHSGDAAGSDDNLDSADFDGLARGARIVFIDLQSGSGSLIVPEPYGSRLLQYAYDSGARVHSGSWYISSILFLFLISYFLFLTYTYRGIADYTYSSEDADVDAFCWYHRTFIAVFAAGNSGVTRGAASILSPALAKNVLAVGAALPGFAAYDVASSSQPAYSEDTYAPDWVKTLNSTTLFSNLF